VVFQLHLVNKDTKTTGMSHQHRATFNCGNRPLVLFIIGMRSNAETISGLSNAHADLSTPQDENRAFWNRCAAGRLFSEER
jgi:hypothetical protein